MAAAAAAAQPAQEDIQSISRYKLRPPFYKRDNATFEEWKYKFNAYMGLIDNEYTRLLQAASNANAELTDAMLRAAADSIEQGEKHVQLSADLKYILINTTTGSAATVCRQFQTSIGFEMYRQLCLRFSIPLGTRSIGYLTRLLKPKFDSNNMEESHAAWEFELSRFERDNGQQLPDSVKIAVLLNETTGALQQHLQLLSGQNPTYAQVKATILEYYRSNTAFTKMQYQQQTSSVGTHYAGGQAPMDIDAFFNKGKGKYNKGKGKRKGKGKSKGKGYGYNPFYNNNKGKGKHYGKNNYQQQPIGYGNPFGAGKGQSNGYNNYKGHQTSNKGKSKGKVKGKQVANTFYRCRQSGHYARDCRVPIHNIGETTTTQDYNDAASQWYAQSDIYDSQWHYQDFTQQPAIAGPTQLCITTNANASRSTRSTRFNPHCGNDWTNKHEQSARHSQCNNVNPQHYDW